MKRAATLFAVFAMTGFGAAQSQTPPPAPSAPQAQSTQPTGRPPIQAKNQAEYQAWQTAIANAQNPEAMAKAADDFAAKFPDSDLRVLLYRAAMNSYRAAGNSDKMMDMGLKVLSIDKDDPEALIVVAQVLQEHTSPTDLDRDQRESQALSFAQHSLETVETDLAVPAGSPPDKVEAYKRYLRSTALAIVGTITSGSSTQTPKQVCVSQSRRIPAIRMRWSFCGWRWRSTRKKNIAMLCSRPIVPSNCPRTILTSARWHAMNEIGW